MHTTFSCHLGGLDLSWNSGRRGDDKAQCLCNPMKVTHTNRSGISHKSYLLGGHYREDQICSGKDWPGEHLLQAPLGVQLPHQIAAVSQTHRTHATHRKVKTAIMIRKYMSLLQVGKFMIARCVFLVFHLLSAPNAHPPLFSTSKSQLSLLARPLEKVIMLCEYVEWFVPCT